jgi:hypothetical protein
MKTIAVAILSLVLSTTRLDAQDVASTLPIVPTPVSVRLATGHFTSHPASSFAPDPRMRRLRSSCALASAIRGAPSRSRAAPRPVRSL